MTRRSAVNSDKAGKPCYAGPRRPSTKQPIARIPEEVQGPGADPKLNRSAHAASTEGHTADVATTNPNALPCSRESVEYVRLKPDPSKKTIKCNTILYYVYNIYISINISYYAILYLTLHITWYDTLIHSLSSRYHSDVNTVMLARMHSPHNGQVCHGNFGGDGRGRWFMKSLCITSCRIMSYRLIFSTF